MTWVTLTLSAVVGCAAPDDLPRDRLGALPFPGMLTFYRAVETTKLGQHRYGSTPSLLQSDEASSGILYTRRAGFLDIAHIRITIDTAQFCTERIRQSMLEGQSLVELPTIEGSIFYVNLRCPLEWLGSSDPRQVQLAEELAIRIGERVTYLMMIWHEIITWYGYRTVAFVDESVSSFTYDDAMSHVVGLRVAGRVLRDQSGSDFDLAVTSALLAEIEELGAVSPTGTDSAVRAVEGLWWAHGRPLKRQLDVGLADGVIRPWLVPGDARTPGTRAVAFSVPTLRNVLGRDLPDAYSLSVDPRLSMARRLTDVLPDHPTRFEERHFMQLIEAIRREMQEQTPGADQPWPTAQ